MMGGNGCPGIYACHISRHIVMGRIRESGYPSEEDVGKDTDDC